MNGKIEQGFIDELLNRLDIVDIINTYVPLKKAGKNHQACCPFHIEKTPSFTVNQQKQFYYCFGCGASGSAISFLMEHLHLGFIDAIEELASKASMQLPHNATLSSKNNQQLTELHELMTMVIDFYARQLREHPQADSVINYLKHRGISGKIAAEFELGFAPSGWDNLISKLGQSEDARQRLLKIGSIIENDKGGYYDRFRNRLIFPIHDQRGRAIGLGGRVLGDDEPKYLNSPETPIFHKGSELYGLYQARKALKNIDRLYIVEGYMDVIALAQYGICNAVASLGTAITSEHLQKMFRITNKLVLCFDGDVAGNKAAWRGLENALPLLRDGKQVHFMFLPAGEDPDTFVRSNGKEAFLKEESQVPLSSFLFNTLKKDINLQTSEGRYELVDKALPYLSKLPASPYKDILIQGLAGIAHYTNQKIESRLATEFTAKSTINSNPKKHVKQSNKRIDKTRWLIRALLHQPELANELGQMTELRSFSSPGIVFLCDLIEFIKNKPNVTLARILEHWRDTKFETPLRELVADADIISEINITRDLFIDAMAILIKSNRQELKEFKEKSSPSDLSDEEKLRYRQMQKP